MRVVVLAGNWVSSVGQAVSARSRLTSPKRPDRKQSDDAKGDGTNGNHGNERPNGARGGALKLTRVG